MTESPSIGFRLRTHVRSELLIIGLVVALAAITRLYQLGSFPSFPAQFPWLGDNPQYPGLYRDEGGVLTVASQFPHILSTYEPSYSILLIKAAQFALGQNYFADRLPSALASIFTAVMVYFTGKAFYDRKDAALVSSLYFVAMTPSIVYGRMDLNENFVVPMLILALYGIAKFEKQGGRWIYLAAIAAAFAPFGKVDGVFVPVFFTIWALTSGGVRQKVLPLVIAWGPIVAGGAVILSLVGSFQGVLYQWFFGLAGREQSLQFLFIQSMPSGYIGTGYIRPDFWYLFGLLSLGVLLVAGARAGSVLTEALFAFVAVSFLSFGIGPYYLIMLFPLFALAAGGAMGHLSKVGTPGALLFYGVFYAPLVGSYIGTAATYIGTNYTLFALNGLLFVAPAAGWLVLNAASRITMKRNLPLAPVVLACFFGLLVLGATILYSYYFSLRSL